MNEQRKHRLLGNINDTLSKLDPSQLSLINSLQLREPLSEFVVGQMRVQSDWLKLVLIKTKKKFYKSVLENLQCC